MLDYLLSVLKDIWIYTIHGETSFFEESVVAFQTVGMVLVMAMIPFGIAIVQELLSPKTKSKFPELDLHTILSEVIPAKKIMCMFALVFISPIVWKIQGITFWFSLSFFMMWAFGIGGLLGIFSNLFHWIKSDENKRNMRVSYLNKISSTKEWVIKSTVWSEILEKEDLERNELSYFLTPFRKTMLELWKKKEDGKWESLFEIFLKAYENLERAISKDEGFTNKHFFHVSVELLMREYENDPKRKYFGDEILPSLSKVKDGLKKLKNRIKESKNGAPMEQVDYKEFISGKVSDMNEREKVVYELPEDKKEDWKKLFEEKE